MKKTGIFYGSSTGHTAHAADLIAQKLGVDKADVYDVEKASPDKVADYDRLILGTSTWGDGDLQDDWFDFIAALGAMDLEGKEIALFGTGDESMADSFCDGVGVLYDKLLDTGATFIGKFNVDGYTFNKSKAIKEGDGGNAVGLLLDSMNRPELTEKRVDAWVATL